MTYADAAPHYWHAGWRGILPLPPQAKKPVPKGWTGQAGGTPSYADLQAWIDGPEGHGNIALRLPPDMIGLDVDHYEAKQGAVALRKLEEKLGPLPPTWTSTSRPGTPAGIRLYRIPEGLAWPGEAGPDLDIIQHGHRYLVAAPSTHPEGRAYVWVTPEGTPTTQPPAPDDLPALPDAWTEHLTGGELAGTATARAAVTLHQLSGWLIHNALGDTPCRRTTAARDRSIHDLNAGRHAAARDGTMRLIRYAAEGHTGVMLALADLRTAFLTATATDTARRPGQAETEYQKLLTGAVGIITAENPPPPAGDPCDTPLWLTTDRPTPSGRTATPAPKTGPQLPDHFWTARTTLDHIRTAARARLVSPDALLGAVLARISMLTHYSCHLPALPRTGSLNIIVALCGHSGDGKGAAIDTATDLLPHRFEPCLCGNGDHAGDRITVPAGSGEGLVRNYFDTVAERVEGPGGKPRTEIHIKLDRRHVLVRIDEGEVLANLSSRQGQTTMQILRQAWSGEELGFSYANKEKNLRVPPHAYRQSVILGIQPQLAKPLFDDAAGGTPQRFCWLGLTDPTIPDDAPTWPGQLPDVTLEGKPWRGELKLDPAVRDELTTTRRSRLAGLYTPDPMDSHRELSRLKIGALLARLEQRTTITAEDWELAGVFMDTSDRVRAWVRDAINTDQANVAEIRARAAAHRQLVIDEHLSGAAVKRVAAGLQAKLADGPMTRAVLRRTCASRDRDHADAAIEALLAEGLVQATESPSHTGSTRIEYRLVAL